MNPHVAHRGGLANTVRRLAPPPRLFLQIGGRRVVNDLVEELYDGIHADARLRPKFTNSRLERENQKKFLEEWLGGEPLYSQHVASAGLRVRHVHIHITADDARAWLRCFRKAMQAVGIEDHDRRTILRTLNPLAMALINEEAVAKQGEHRCVRTKRVEAARRAAQQGDVAAVSDALTDARLLAEAGPAMLSAAAGRGRLDVARALLHAGVDPNIPSFSGWYGGSHTPVCSARQKRKAALVDLLREHGAIDDIFTEATLGNVEGVEDCLARDPSLANVADPAQDFFRLTPLYHAVFAGQREVAERLLARHAEPGPLSTLLTRSAADRSDVALVRLLLEHGADATRIGVGRWVLDERMAGLLLKSGADVNYESSPWASWLWKCCTGNHGQKDDPAYVEAVLTRGVRNVNAIHDHWGRAALHFAAKAGFVESIGVLLAHGADPNLQDVSGETPLFHAFRAGKSIDPARTARVLLDAGADPDMMDRKGRTLAVAFPKSRDVLSRRE